MVHGPIWAPEEVPVQVDGAVKALGVHYDLALTGQTQLDLSTSELRQLLAAARYKLASPDTLRVVVESCLINKVAYRGVLSGWSLQQTMSLDKHLTAEYRRRTLDNKTCQEEPLFQPAESGRLGVRRLIQDREKSIVDRLRDSPRLVRMAVSEMLELSRLTRDSAQKVVLWGDSLLDYAASSKQRLRPPQAYSTGGWTCPL